jgi:glycerophosphoryl diester phosphodiesterase
VRARAYLPRVVGHRGAAGLAPENTLEGLGEAARLGARAVEFDVKLSADGVAVLMHDDTLDRTTDGRGPAAAASARALCRLDAGAWFGAAWRGARVPTLAEALDLVLARRLQADIEIKPSPGREVETALAVVAEIDRRWPRRRRPPLLTSFSRLALAAARGAAPDRPRGLLVWERPEDWERAARDLDCGWVLVADRFVTRAWAAAIRRAGFGLGIYTVNKPRRAATLLRWGAQAIVTDRPDLLLPLAVRTP